MSSLDFSPQTDPPLRLMMAFSSVFPDVEPQLIACMPDRDLTIALAAHAPQPMLAARYTLHSVEMGGDAAVSFSLQSAKTWRGLNGRPLPRWARYAAGLILAIEVPAGTPGSDGFSAVISGNEPVGPRYEFAVGLLFAALLDHWQAEAARYSPAQLRAVVERVRRDLTDN